MLGLPNILKKRLGRYSWLQSAIFSAVFLAVVVLIWPHPAYADVWDSVMSGIASLLLVFAGWIGWVALQLIGLLVEVAQFNNFIHAPAVERGWVIVRDVANMFFIVILLLIAFGSVFRIEEYQYKKVLGKLLIMAVLVNFSKSITGFFIDIAQVVMLTFVNGFKEAAAGNFINGFHIADMFEFAESGTEAQAGSASAFLGAAALALITIIITTIVVAIYLIVFLLRIIALWFLTIISPLAYLLSAFPGDARKYSSQWWDYFGKYATTGPILAFFLWLSLAVMQFGADATSYGFNVSDSEYSIPAATVTKIGQADVMLSFIINIILLMGGLWMTQQLGVAGGKLAGSAFNKIQQAPGKSLKAIGQGAWTTTKWAGRGIDKLQMKGQRMIGVEAPRSLNLGMIRKGYRASREQKLDDYHTGLAGDWHETFNKYSSVKQYLGWTKSKNKKEKDNDQANWIDDRVKTRKKWSEELITRKEKTDFETEKVNLLVQESNIDTKLNEKSKSDGTLTFDNDAITKKLGAELVKEWLDQAKALRDTGEISKAETLEKRADDFDKQLKSTDPAIYLNKNDEPAISLLASLAKEKNKVRERISLLDTKLKGDVVADDARREKVRDRVANYAEQMEETSAKLRRPRFGVQTSPGTAFGEREREIKRAKTKSEIMQTTSGETDSVKEELYKNILANKMDEVIACLQILAENGDLNEQFKGDARFAAMLKEAFRSGHAGGFNFGDRGEALARSFDSTNVTPENMQAWLRHVFEDKLKLTESESARQATKIGNISFAAGSGQYFGMAAGDTIRGGHQYFDPSIETEKDGRVVLKANENHLNASIGKMKNYYAQTKWRKMHFGNFVTEMSDGSPGHLSSFGKFNLAKMTATEVGQIKQARPDFWDKVGSPKILDEMLLYAEDIVQGKIHGVEAGQAQIVRAVVDELRRLRTQLPKNQKGGGGDD